MASTQASFELNSPGADTEHAKAKDDVETGRRQSVAVGEMAAAPRTHQARNRHLAWGKHGLKVMWSSMIFMLIVYQFDNALMYNYRNYATSTFNNVGGLSTLGVVGSIVFAVFKPPIAKLSTVIGRGETYLFCVSCYLLGYILCASSGSFGTYAGGFVFSQIGQTGVNIMNDIVISDISSMRWRGFAISASFVPFFITPWISGFIVEDVVRPDGIGWRWGIGMFAIIMPIAASFIIGSLLFYQQFCSRIDLGGSILLAGGFTLFLVPFSISGSDSNKWKTGWVIALIVVGFVILVGMVFYEGKTASHPILPARYLKSMTICLCCIIAALDTLGFQGTHTYFYTWAIVVHAMGARTATFLNYVNGVTQAVFGLVGGAIMAKTQEYKWLMVMGAVIKLIGYGIMIRLRGAGNSRAELFVVQAIQGVGSGFIEIIVIVGAQAVVPHSEMPQVTALVLSFAFIGSAIGTASAGGIYTGTFRDGLRSHLGSLATDELVDSMFESITVAAPAEGTAQRTAVNLAYSDVLRLITYAAVATSVVVLALTLFLPNVRLPKTVDPMSEESAESSDLDVHSQDGKGSARATTRADLTLH